MQFFCYIPTSNNNLSSSFCKASRSLRWCQDSGCTVILLSTFGVIENAPYRKLVEIRDPGWHDPMLLGRLRRTAFVDGEDLRNDVLTPVMNMEKHWTITGIEKLSESCRIKILNKPNSWCLCPPAPPVFGIYWLMAGRNATHLEIKDLTLPW